MNTELIYPIKSVNPSVKIKPIMSFDIETVVNPSTRVLVPIILTLAWQIEGVTDSAIFSINLDNINNGSIELAVEQIWNEFFTFLTNLVTKFPAITVFVHNLGSFDGYLLAPELAKIFGEGVNILMDADHKYISIDIKINKTKVSFRDSIRVFDISLDKLALSWHIDGKTQPWTPEWNWENLIINKDQIMWEIFKVYAVNDSIVLVQCIVKAQEFYFKNYKVDVATIYSTASLAVRIFRVNHLEDKTLYGLSPKIDSYIRLAYFSGACDFYMRHGKNLYYYDVNSLYPYVMLQDIPGKVIRYYSNLLSLNEFFGFAKVKVSYNGSEPLLPYRDEMGKITYPTGSWIGTYFTPELEAAQIHGYKITPISGVEFSKIKPFNSYIEHFYQLKINSTGSERLQAKLILNTLYGYFGRAVLMPQTEIININTANILQQTGVVNNMVQLTPDIFIVQYLPSSIYTMPRGLSKSEISELSKLMKTSINKNSNVGLAAAVTAYGRIHINKFKFIKGNPCYYSDTDSVFLSKPLDPKYLSNELGYMKDELNGKTMETAVFLGAKCYGYTVDGESKSVYAGIPRNSLPISVFIDLANNKAVEIPGRGEILTKHFVNQNITADSRTKPLILQPYLTKTYNPETNRYIPPKISQGHVVFIKHTINKLIGNI